MKTRPQMFNSNRGFGLNPKSLTLCKLSPKKQNFDQTNIKSKMTSPGYIDCPKVPFLIALLNRQVPSLNPVTSSTNADMEVQTLINKIMLKHDSLKVKTPVKKDGGKPYYNRKAIHSIRSIKSHPDDAFFSGAWLFNESVAPLWFKRELKKLNCDQAIMLTPEWMEWYIPCYSFIKSKNQTIDLKEDEMVFKTPGAWLFRFQDMPLWFQSEVKRILERKIILNYLKENDLEWMKWYTPIKPIFMFKSNQKEEKCDNMDEDIAFYSGAWLFDVLCAPHWLQSCLDFRSYSSCTDPTFTSFSTTHQTISVNRITIANLQKGSQGENVAIGEEEEEKEEKKKELEQQSIYEMKKKKAPIYSFIKSKFNQLKYSIMTPSLFKNESNRIYDSKNMNIDSQPSLCPSIKKKCVHCFPFASISTSSSTLKQLVPEAPKSSMPKKKLIEKFKHLFSLGRRNREH